MRRNNGGTDRQSDAIQEIAPRDFTTHAQFATICIFVQWNPRPSAVRTRPIQPYALLLSRECVMSAGQPDFRCLGIIGLLHRRLRSLESDAAVGPVTKRLGHRSAAAAQRKCRLASEIVLLAIGIDQFD